MAPPASPPSAAGAEGEAVGLSTAVLSGLSNALALADALALAEAAAAPALPAAAGVSGGEGVTEGEAPRERLAVGVGV